MSERLKQAWYGGGDPDRTGDPRLMSPLLYQLSYTAMACLYQAKRFSVKPASAVTGWEWGVESADEVGIQPGKRADNFGPDFVEHGGSPALAHPVERAFDHHLLAVTNHRPAQPDDFHTARG